MSNKTTRKKFRPPLKTHSEGGSLTCSQASNASSAACIGVAVGSQERVRKESSQSWLSQLSAADYPGPAKDASNGVSNISQSTSQSYNYFGSAKDRLQVDHSLCSDIDHEQNGGSVCEGGESIQPSPAAETWTHSDTALSCCNEDRVSECGHQRNAPEVVQQNIFDFLDSGAGAGVEYVVNNKDRDSSPPALRTNFDLAGSETASSKFDLLTNLCSPHSEGEMANEVPKAPSRFQRKNKPTARNYNYGNILPKLRPQKRAAIKKNRTRTKKRVSLVVHQTHSSTVPSVSFETAAEDSLMSKGDLSVYDYQPTPQQEETRYEEGEILQSTELNNSRISKRTREEQVSEERVHVFYTHTRTHTMHLVHPNLLSDNHFSGSMSPYHHQPTL